MGFLSLFYLLKLRSVLLCLRAPAEPDVVTAMRDVASYRGPDDAGYLVTVRRVSAIGG